MFESLSCSHCPSTNTKVLSYVHFLVATIDNGSEAHFVYTDFWKVFHMINRSTFALSVVWQVS